MQYLIDVETQTVRTADGALIPTDQVPATTREILAARTAEHEADKLLRKAKEAAEAAATAKQAEEDAE